MQRKVGITRMSSRIAKKKKNTYGFTKAETKRFQRHGKLYNAEDKMLKETFKHLQFMGYMALRDRYGFGKTRLVRFYKCMQSVFDEYSADRITSKQLLTYCESKKIDVHKWIRSITQTEKLKLSNVAKYKANTLQTMKVLDASILVYGMISASVLKEQFDFSSPEIERFYGHISYYIDSYVRDYLNDDMINSIMIEECGLDLYREDGVVNA